MVTLLCLEALKDEEVVVSKFAMQLELSMYLFLQLVVTFSLLFGCLSSFSES
jgi:hypothetical protein